MSNINKQLLEIAELACKRARARGAREAGAGVRSSKRFKVVIRDGKQEELKASESRRLSIRVFVDGRYGKHTTSNLEREAVGRFVDEAVEMTRYLMPDKHRSLPTPDLYQHRSEKELKVYDPAQASICIGDFSGVGIIGKAPVIRGRRPVVDVGIVVVQPEKEGGVFFLEPFNA